MVFGWTGDVECGIDCVKVHLGQHSTENAWGKTSQCKNTKFIELNWFELNTHSRAHRTNRMNLDLWQCVRRSLVLVFFSVNAGIVVVAIPKYWNRSKRAYMQNTTCNTNFRSRNREANSIKSRFNYCKNEMCNVLHYLTCTWWSLSIILIRSYLLFHVVVLTLAFGVWSFCFSLFRFATGSIALCKWKANLK